MQEKKEMREVERGGEGCEKVRKRERDWERKRQRGASGK